MLGSYQYKTDFFKLLLFIQHGYYTVTSNICMHAKECESVLQFTDVINEKPT